MIIIEIIRYKSHTLMISEEELSFLVSMPGEGKYPMQD